MRDAFPETPRSLLSQLGRGSDGTLDHGAWRQFFDLYHHAIWVSALDAFRRFRWNRVPEELLEEVIADVVISFFKSDFTYDPNRGRFRNFLRQLTAWRIMDRLGKLPKATESLETVEETAEELADSRLPGDGVEAREKEAFRAALLAMMLEEVRQQVDPQTFLIFEMTKVRGEKPEAVAARLKVKRNIIDGAVHRVFRRLQALAALPEYQKEFQSWNSDDV